MNISELERSIVHMTDVSDVDSDQYDINEDEVINY